MYERVIKFNNGLFLATTLSKLDDEVELLTKYANSLDIKDEEIKYFQNNIVRLYDNYKESILQNIYDEVLNRCGMSKVFNNKQPQVEVGYSEDEKTLNIDDKTDRFIGKVLDKINSYYKI